MAVVQTATVTGRGAWQQVGAWSAATDSGSSISIDVATLTAT